LKITWEHKKRKRKVDRHYHTRIAGLAKKNLLKLKLKILENYLIAL
jgi:hypothetical protein